MIGQPLFWARDWGMTTGFEVRLLKPDLGQQKKLFWKTPRIVLESAISEWNGSCGKQVLVAKMLCYVSLPDCVVTEFMLRDKARGQELLQAVCILFLNEFTSFKVHDD